MSAPERALPFWAGRTAAFLGIVLVAFSVRNAVSAISPIVDAIVRDVPLGSIEQGIIGTIPPIAFALSAIFGATLARRLGIERLLTLAIVAMVLGHLTRAASLSFPMLLIGTIVALAGAGIGNVLLPPLVKKYFPDRLGVVTALYVSIVSVGAAVPPGLASPVTDAAGWRVSLGLWAVVSAVCLLPWAFILLGHRRERMRAAAADELPLADTRHRLMRPIWRSRVGWTLGLTMALSSGHVYAAYAWLPQLLIDTAGVTPAEAGALLGIYALVGVPMALIVPVLAARMRNVSGLLYTGLAFFMAGYVGLIFAPAASPLLWIVLIGLGPLIFPLVLTLINLRSRTQLGSVTLSGFVQAIGYSVGALGPLLFGVMHSISGGWLVPLLFFMATIVATAFLGLSLRHPVYVEDELGHSGLEPGTPS